MKKVKNLIAVAVIATMAISFSGCSLVQRTEESVNGTVLAEVNGSEITLGEVNEILANDIEGLKAQFGEDYEANLDPDTAEALKNARLQVVDMLIENRLLTQEGEKIGVLPLTEEEKDDAVEVEIQRLIELYGGEEEFQTQLTAAGFTEESYRELVREDLEVMAVIDEITIGVEVADEDVEAYFMENESTFISEPGQATTRHLLFTTEEAAKEASHNIIAGEVTFTELFEEYEGNKEVQMSPDVTEEELALPIAEDLGVVSHAEANFDPLFLQGLLPLKDGDVSEPVQSSFGYHIIEATEVTDTKLSTYEEMEEDIRNYLVMVEEEALYNTKVEELESAAEIVKYEGRL